jgi:hypothetical protein
MIYFIQSYPPKPAENLPLVRRMPDFYPLKPPDMTAIREHPDPGQLSACLKIRSITGEKSFFHAQTARY